MISPFLKVVVDNKEEGKFRQRALNACPIEHMEALWGYVRGDTAYVCAFIKMDLDKNKTNTRRVTPLGEGPEDSWELDAHDDDARDSQVWDEIEGRHIKLELLGTIHTHPDCDDAVPSEHDIRGLLKTQESIMAVCCIEFKNKGLKNQRRVTKIEYWPAMRPLKVERKKNYESFAAKAGKSRANKRRRKS